MNKKVYEKPTVAVATMETESFIAASLDKNLNSTEILPDAMLSKENKGFDIWGGDEEE